MSDQHMSEQQSNVPAHKEEDGLVDAFAAIAIIALIVTTVSFWLKSM
ncbi:MAG: hypothetical protein JWM78_2360 [Verrucomicrobiaceae bacterium]|nr:hypothetical protein [Verrucomicrobiaceae bacterium]